MAKQVRILIQTPPIDGKQYKPNQAVTFDDAVADHLVEQGYADATPEAVEFALSEGQTAVVHEVPVEEAATDSQAGDDADPQDAENAAADDTEAAEVKKTSKKSKK